MAREKGFSNLNKQISIQKHRKLRIYDEKRAAKYFITNNYFNVINGFESLILDNANENKIYSKRKNITDFYRVHQLDKKISEQLFLQIANIETELKTKIAYYFCEKYCQSGIVDNLKYQEICCYSIPNSSNGKPKYTNYFYKTRINRRTNTSEIDSNKTHKLFSKHAAYITTNQVDFLGSISQNRDKSNIYYLKGHFLGTIKGIKTNEFKGTLTIDINQNQRLSLTTGIGCQVHLSNIKGNLQSLSYSDFCKIKYPYISSYKKPPFGVIINTLMLNDLIVLFHGLDNDIQNKIVSEIGDFNINQSGKEEFICALEILIELRNVTAHYGLVTRYRTSSNLNIASTLIGRLYLTPKTRDKVLRFFDIIKVLSLFHSFSNVKICRRIICYINVNRLHLKSDINFNFYNRIGAKKVSPWLTILKS